MNNQPVLALNATHESNQVSDKYNFFSSADIVNFFNNKNWSMTDYKQVVPRVKSAEHAKHMITFEHEDYLGLNNIPRILLTNSHDGSCSFTLHTGIFRVVCANGLIVGSKFEQVRIRHIHTTEDEVYKSIDELVDQFNPVLNRIDEFSATTLNEDQKFDLAHRIAKDRFTKFNDLDVHKLLIPTRREDDGEDIWTVGNVVQEKCMKGGMKINKRKVRPIKGIDRTIGFNTAVWDVMEEMAELVG